RQPFAQLFDGSFRRNEIDPVGVNFDDLRTLCLQPFNHLLEQVAPNLSDTRGRFEVGKVSLRKTQITIEAIDQDLEGVLQSVKVTTVRRVLCLAHVRLSLKAEAPQVSEEMAKNLELIVYRETIELKHDRG